MSLNVMVVESDSGSADRAVRELTEAGHVALRCHDAGAPPFPCRGVADLSSCPLRSHAVDVALVVRSHRRSQPTLRESGARCALMQRVPLVVAGPDVLDPYTAHEACAVEPGDDVVEACERVAVGEMTEHSRIATEALLAARVPADIPAGARVRVTRRHGALLVVLKGVESLGRPQLDAAVVRVTAKVREFDPFARGLDVIVESAS